MYEFIFWLCLAADPTCDRYHGAGHSYQTFYGAPSKKECEDGFKEWDALEPNPPGTVSNHICKAIEEPL